MLDDALEESFNDILEDEKKADAVVFSADDFMPLTGTLAPPQEKPPPLPAVPPPDIIDVSLDDTVDDHDTISDDEHLDDDEECRSIVHPLEHMGITSSTCSVRVYMPKYEVINELPLVNM